MFQKISDEQLLDEEWKSVVGYEGLYEVSNLGRVKSLWNQYGRGAMFRKQSNDSRTYPAMTMRNRHGTSITKAVHRMVAEAFIGPCPEGKECCHLDGNKKNNVATNLRWVTSKENNGHKERHGTLVFGENHPNTKLSNSTAIAMRKDYQDGMRQCNIVRKYGVIQATVYEIVTGKGWGLVK